MERGPEARDLPGLQNRPAMSNPAGPPKRETAATQPAAGPPGYADGLLARISAISRQVPPYSYACGDAGADHGDLVALATLVNQLGDWVAMGGALPASWEHGQRHGPYSARPG